MSGMPSINIVFTELAKSVSKRGERGIIAMIIKESSVPATNPVVCTAVADIPAGLSADNKKQIELALKGYVNTPKKVIAYVLASSAEDYTDALNYFKTVKWHYLVVPTVATDELTSDVVDFIKAERANNNLVKAVLPNTTANCEGIINYTTTGAIVDDTTYTAEEYCARIAGILAGTPISMSATYATLDELTDCSRLTKVEMDAAVAAGKFFLWWDGEKVKTSRAVNSLTTTTASKGAQFQKIKIVEAMDMITDDIRKTVQDEYIGKYPNTYDNKELLMNAIASYFDGLVIEGVIEKYTIDIDLDANRAYLQNKGIDTSDMSDEEIKKANTGSNVYLEATVGMLDVIEDLTLNISI